MVRSGLVRVGSPTPGAAPFDAIQRRTGAPREMLTARLCKLDATGVITRSRCSDRPPRHEYELTASGEEFLPVMAGLYAWGAAHATPAPPDEQAPLPAAGTA